MVKVGDILEIPLSDGRKAYCQYVHNDRKIGPLIMVFDLITADRVDICCLINRKALFPPVFTGVRAAVRSGLWPIIGHLPVDNFEYPNFVSTFLNTKTGKAGIWYLWNGKESIRIGLELPERYKDLEFLVGWSPHDIVQRIETGEYPYPYGDLIQKNEFVPRNISSPGKN